MSDLAPLHDLLSEMVQAYSQKNQAPHIPTPAEIGTHLHPLLDRMCEEAEKRNASDIFISAGFPPAIKVGGTLTPMPHKALTGADPAAIAESTMNPDQLEAFNRDWEINYSVQSRSNTRYRVNAYHEQGRVGMVLRRVSQDIPEMKTLGLPEKLQELALAPRGLLILAGPTGSGKSTTMACLIDRINHTREGHIITLEDPLEYLHRHDRCIVSQREICTDTESYLTSLRATLRQSPDVILLGEMRDHETIQTAMTAAETGHLVLSSLHTLGAANTIERIMDVFEPSQQHQIALQLSMVLQAVISQQLIPDVDGRNIPVFEIMRLTPAIRNMIRDNKVHQIEGVISTSGQEQMRSMDQSLLELYKKGRITRDTALKYALNADMLKRRLM